MQNDDKTKLRKGLLKRRLELSQDEVDTASEKIVNTLTINLLSNDYRMIYIYQTIKKYNEVNTSEFIDLIRSNYPDVEVTIAPNKISQSVQIPKGKYYDLVVIPVLGFDRRGFRLGYGGGYYDKFLASNKYKKAIGLAYSLSEIEEIPNEPHDIKMNEIITENEVIEFY